eukprot:gene25049-33561_t
MLQIDVSICDGYFGSGNYSQQNNNIPRLGDGAIFHISNKNVSKRAYDMVTELMDGLEIENEKKPSIVAFPVARIEKIGQGSSSTVFKSVLLRTLTLCAEKVVAVDDTSKRAQLRRELDSLQAAFREARGERSIESSQQSPFIVQLLEVLSNPLDGTLSICLEYLDGGSLQDLIKDGGCRDEGRLASIAFQMTAGLVFLHGLRVMHRDLKPSNALINAAGRVKLADFGLARSLDSGTSLAESFVGTFDYMSPERLTGEAYSLLSDVWSLGITMYTVSLGVHPFEGRKGYWELVHATQEGEVPRPPSSIFGDRFGSFVSQACMRDHRQRPSASELLRHPFVAHLEECAVCAATSSSSPSPSPSSSSSSSNSSSSSSSSSSSAAVALRKKADSSSLSRVSSGRRVTRPFLSGNSRNYTASISGAGAGAGRVRPRYAVPDSDSAPILPLLVSPNPNPNLMRIRAEDMDADKEKASADIRKLVKYWKAYVTQLRRFNATFPAVLTVGPHSHSNGNGNGSSHGNGNGNGNGSLSGATPRSMHRYKTTPRAGPRSDRCRSVPTTARAELTEAGAGAGADHAAGEGAAQIQIPLDLDASIVERLAGGLKWAAGPLKTAFAAAVADMRQEILKETLALSPSPAPDLSPSSAAASASVGSEKSHHGRMRRGLGGAAAAAAGGGGGQSHARRAGERRVTLPAPEESASSSRLLPSLSVRAGARAGAVPTAALLLDGGPPSSSVAVPAAARRSRSQTLVTSARRGSSKAALPPAPAPAPPPLAGLPILLAAKGAASSPRPRPSASPGGSLSDDESFMSHPDRRRRRTSRLGGLAQPLDSPSEESCATATCPSPRPLLLSETAFGDFPREQQAAAVYSGGLEEELSPPYGREYASDSALQDMAAGRGYRHRRSPLLLLRRRAEAEAEAEAEERGAAAGAEAEAEEAAVLETCRSALDQDQDHDQDQPGAMAMAVAVAGTEVDSASDRDDEEYQDAHSNSNSNSDSDSDDGRGGGAVGLLCLSPPLR